jgi:hypothetical protein
VAQVGYVFFQNYFHFRDLQSCERRSIFPSLLDTPSGQSLRREGFYIGFRSIVVRLPQKTPVTKAALWPGGSAALVAGREWQQGNVPGLLDRAREAALVRRAHSRQTPRYDLPAFGHKPLQQTNIAIRDCVNLLGAELAYLLAAEELAATAGTATLRATAGPSPWTTLSRTALSTRPTLRWTALGCCCARLGRLSLCFVCHFVPLLSSWLPAPGFQPGLW